MAATDSPMADAVLLEAIREGRLTPVGELSLRFIEGRLAWLRTEAECDRRRMREGRQLLHRMVKCVREDRAVTPGNTRLARLTDSVDDYLRRTHRASFDELEKRLGDIEREGP